jgi:hypothetical protein
MHGRFFVFQLLVHPNPAEEDVSMGGASCLPQDLLDLIDALQFTLIQEYFGFVSDIIDDILEETGSARTKLLALRDVMRKLGPATSMLANSTCDEIDWVEEMIEAS